MVMQKKVWARQAWVTDTGVGRRNFTVIPPRIPCATTAASATQASRRTPARGSLRAVHTARIVVSRPTKVATIRWPCSKNTPPTMGGISMPYDSGQSGTARPDPVLVTRPPTKMSASVQAAVKTANRWRQGLKAGSPAVVIGGEGEARAGDAPTTGTSPGRPSALEGEVDLGGLARLDRHLLRLGLELLVVRLDLVVARRQALDLEGPVLLGDREERMVQDRDVGAHPGMHVAAHREHDLLLVEGLGGLHALARLADVELRVHGRPRMDV